MINNLYAQNQLNFGTLNLRQVKSLVKGLEGTPYKIVSEKIDGKVIAGLCEVVPKAANRSEAEVGNCPLVQGGRYLVESAENSVKALRALFRRMNPDLPLTSGGKEVISPRIFNA